MTVEEAIALHEKYKTAGFVQSVRMDINELVKMVIWQSNEIDLLKCCGNCEYWNQTYNQCEEPESRERYGGTGNHSDRDDTCDKWKGVK